MRRALLLATLALLCAASTAHAVVGGRPATEPYPWAASLEEDGEHICGASLLAPDRVLTAAHCVESTRAGRLTVVLGRTDLTTSAGEEIGVSDIEIHPNYAEDESGGHDVAILRLARPSVQPTIAIAGPQERSLWEPGDQARVVGWGTSFFLVGPSPDDLHEVDVSIVSDERCGDLDPFFDPRTMLCAGEELGGRDACQGDSGGPLMVRGASGWLQVGSVSSGQGCGFPLFYGVYARVADDPLRSWIVERTSADPAGDDETTEPARRSGARVEVVRKRIGSARRAKRRGFLKVRVRSSEPVTAVRAVLRRKGRVVARGRRPSLDGRGRLRMSVRRVRAGRHRLVLRAVDGSGSTVRSRAAVRVTR